MAIDISQSYSKELMLWLGAIFLVFPTIFTIARLAAKRLGPKSLTIDDYLAVVAWTINIACCTCTLIAAVDGELGQHQRVYPDGQPILDDPQFLVYEKTKWAVNMLSVLGLGVVKLSILTFYLQIFSIGSFRIQAYVVMTLVGMWTISFFFTNLFTCWPVTPLVEPFYGNKCINDIVMWEASTVSDVILDFIILIMPIPQVLALHMRWSQKMLVIGIFLLGGCIVGISIVRLLVWFQIADQFAIHYNDETYFTSPVFFWVVIELGLACMCAALPTMRPLWHLFSGKRNRSKYYSSGRTPRPSGGMKMADFNKGSDSATQPDPWEPGTDPRYTIDIQGKASNEDGRPEMQRSQGQDAVGREGAGSYSSETNAHLLEVFRSSRVSQSSEHVVV